METRYNFKQILRHCKVASYERVENELAESTWLGEIFGAPLILGRVDHPKHGKIAVAFIHGSEVLQRNVLFLIERQLGPSQDLIEEPRNINPGVDLLNELAELAVGLKRSQIKLAFWPDSVLSDIKIREGS